MSLHATDFLAHEARALLTRVDGVRPLVLSDAMAPAANISRSAQAAIERYLAAGRLAMRDRIADYLDWLASAEAGGIGAREAQRRFSVLRMRFNRIVTQFDLFADALSQRGERDTGVWLAGLDALASDGLQLAGRYECPPLLCYLDRGIGAAIRRARTRLPGGGENPVSIIRVPRERMVGTSVASSLLHEVGHQAAALLGLVASLREELRQRIALATGEAKRAWSCFERWISEIIADFWSISRIGIASTMGLVGVVSLPRRFVFRIGPDDPHPFPWIRVKLGCALGARLFPDPQWARLAHLWESFYPRAGVDPETRNLIVALEDRLGDFVGLLVNHRPRSLGGEHLAGAMDLGERSPQKLRAIRGIWINQPDSLRTLTPCIAVAALGQARADGSLTPTAEARMLRRLLDQWALQRALGPGFRTSARPRAFIPHLVLSSHERRL